MSSSETPELEHWKRRAILTCDEMRRAEELSCARGTHDFYDLMQVAGRAVANAVMEYFEPCPVLVLCGVGNNGGDGYVAAEVLRQAGWSVRLASLGQPTTSEAQRAAAAWQGVTEAFGPELLDDDVGLVVDALFGTGLTRPLEGLAAQMIAAVRERKLPVVSADIPSGIDGDTGRVLGCAFRADITVTFFRKKRGHVLLPGLAHCGEVIVADTGMYSDVLDQIKPIIAENESALFAALKPKYEVQNHKYHRGHALIFGGAELTGASRLAARAAQRAGAGLVTLGVPVAAWPVYAAAMESVMVRALENFATALEILNNPKINTALIGPGLGLGSERKELVLAALATQKPCVLDADALMLFEGESHLLLDSLHDKCVLTPHEGEFRRLFGAEMDENDDKITKTMHVAAKFGCVVLHKGADTVVAGPDGYAVVNTDAPPWLATAGTGDVLAGMIIGHLAAGMPCFAAACLAASLHGQAASAFGEGLIAEDIVDMIPYVLQGDL